MLFQLSRRKTINERHSANDRGQRVNEQIRISPVRLIGVNGEQLGVVPTAQALDLAAKRNWTWSKSHRWNGLRSAKYWITASSVINSRERGTRRKPHQQKLKEIRVRPKTGDHDIETKVNQARRFLEHKDKVLVNVLFRGRELQHIDEGRRIIISILEKLADLAKVEKAPSMEGKRMTAMLAPKA